MSEVLTHQLVSSFYWPYIRIVNEPVTSSCQHRDSDGRMCSIFFLSGLAGIEFPVIVVTNNILSDPSYFLCKCNPVL